MWKVHVPKEAEYGGRGGTGLSCQSDVQADLTPEPQQTDVKRVA